MKNVSWNYYNKFEEVNKKYLPECGDGETMATQIVTAVNKLVYKWYNDGDVYDNTYILTGWANDLSSYANWLYGLNDKQICDILNKIETANNDVEYTNLLKDLADLTLNETYLSKYNNLAKSGSIYDFRGPFEFVELDYSEDEEEYGYEEDY